MAITDRIEEPRTDGDEARHGGGDANGSQNGEAGALTALLEGLVAAERGDFSRRLEDDQAGVLGEIAAAYNSLVERNQRNVEELRRVGRIVGREGNPSERFHLEGAEGGWAEKAQAINDLIDDLLRPTTEVARVIMAVADGDLSQKTALEFDGQPVKGEFARVGRAVNAMVDQLSSFAAEVSRVAKEVGTEGELGGQADVPGVSGIWKDLTENVNSMASNLTSQVRNIAHVATAVADGDLSQKITVEAKGEVAALADTINSMTDTLRTFADEVTRVAREVGTEGKLGGQAQVAGVSGIWEDLTDNVNSMASNLTSQVRNIAHVATAVADGDLSQKITVEAKGEVAALADTINSMTDTLRTFADEVTRVAREVGTEGKLGGQADVPGVAGTWKDLTDNVNNMASNLTSQVRNIAHVATAVADGDLSQKITVDVQGEILELKDTMNSMVDQLSSFADEVTRVAREVGTEGELGGQAQVAGVSGIWEDLTDNVNNMASNLTSQVRNIAQVATAVADGDLSQKITVEAKGEVAALAETINSMTDTLRTFADEVTRVAREVGTEGKLGGQADVPGVAGIWKDLTNNVNQLAANLTTQVRAIAEVSTAVTQGDLTRSISVDAQGEVAELKDNINQMIQNLKATTQKNAEQDWLKTNLAHISQRMQGQRDLQTVTRLIMSELTPTVSAQHGAFFLTRLDDDGQDTLHLVASYGYSARKGIATRFRFGDGLVGQAALERQPILVVDPPTDYVHIRSGLGSAAPANIIVLPVVFEDEVLGVIELASFRPFSEVDRTFLDQVVETIGVVLNTIKANMRTEELLEQSQLLAQELQSQQLELQQTNAELEEKALLLEEQNRNIEIKNREIEMARLGLVEKAEQLAQSSRYKSEFLANVSHELRTPLNSLLILAQLLLENEGGNLTEEQVDYIGSIAEAGRELLDLIDDILDLSKIESGRMDVRAAPVRLTDLAEFVEQTFRPVATKKALGFTVTVDPDVPAAITTDDHRVRQVLKNLLSNAFKFTETGEVRLEVNRDGPGRIAFAVVDTGIGVPPDKLDLIFEAFRQADGTTSRQFGGTGLGLSISREIAHLLGGEIRVASAVGDGATFTLVLPEAYAATTDEETTIEALAALGSAVEAAETTPGRRRVLVVSEDSERLGELTDLMAVLGTDPVGVDTATAHAGLLDDGIDAALVDLEPSGTGGFAVLRSLAEDPRLNGFLVLTYRSRELLRTERAHVRACSEVLDVREISSADELEVAVARFSLSPVTPPADSAGTGNQELGGSRILVVDDDRRNVFAITHALKSRGAAVLSAGNGREAIEILDREAVDLVVMDLMMPEMDGYEAMAAIRERRDDLRKIPIVAVTAKAMSGDRQRTLRAGANDYLAKPVGVDDLVATIRRCLAP